MSIEGFNYFKNSVDICNLFSINELYTTIGTPKKLHYLIANNLGVNFINEVINRETTSIKDLNLAIEDKHSFTPLHLAVIKGNLIAVELLINKMKEDPNLLEEAINQKDNKGFTPLHHAAFNPNREIAKLLKSKGADKKLINKKGATPKLLKIAAGIKKPEKAKSSLYLERPGGLLKGFDTLKGEEIKRITGLNEWIENSVTHDFNDLWCFGSLVPYTQYVDKVLCTRYAEYAQCPPKLILSINDAIPGDKNYQIVAFGDIPKDKIVANYGGYARKKDSQSFISFEKYFSENNNCYEFENIDGTEGNASRWLNHGFPNVIPIEVVTNGINQQAFLSIDPIQEGEQIVYNYGMAHGRLIYGRMVLFGKERMENFASLGLHEIIDYYNDLSKLHHNTQDSHAYAYQCEMEKYAIESKLFYIFGTPLAQIYLFSQGTMDFIDLYNLFDSNENIINIFKHINSCEYKYVQVFAHVMAKFQGSLEAQPESVRSSVKKWMFDQVEKIDFLAIMKGILKIDDSLNKKEISPDSIEAYLREMDEFLANYQWKDDPNHFYSKTHFAKLDMDYRLEYEDPQDILTPLIPFTKLLSESDKSLKEHNLECIRYLLSVIQKEKESGKNHL